MIVIYHAESSIDAHLLRGLLEQQGIASRILGEFLQGAVGELPARGLISVSVAAEDAARARTVVHEFEDNMAMQAQWDEQEWRTGVETGDRHLPLHAEHGLPPSAPQGRDPRGNPGSDWQTLGLFAAMAAALAAACLGTVARD